MQIRALKAFSTGTFAMEQYEIRDVDGTLAASLIAQGLAAEVGGGVLVVHIDENGTLDKTWQEIHDNPVAVILDDAGSHMDAGSRMFVSQTFMNPANYVVVAVAGDSGAAFIAQHASDYPTYTDK